MLDCKSDPDVRAYFEARGGLVWCVSGEGMAHPVDAQEGDRDAGRRVRWDAVSGDRTLFADKLTAAEMEHSTATYYPVIMRRYLQLVATVQDAQHGEGAPRDPHEVVGLLHPAALKEAAQKVKDVPGMAAVLTTLEHDFGDDEHTEKALLGFRHRYSTLLEGVAGGGLGVGDGTLVLEQTVRARRPVLFSLAVEAYQDTGRKIGTWALLEMQRVAAALRSDQWARRGGRCLLVLDEFGQLGRETSRVVTLLEMARSAGIGVLLATQGITSLRDLGEDAREGKALVGTILNNCNTKAVMKLGSDADREWWVTYFGEETVTDPATGKTTKRPLVSAEELAALKQGQAVLHRDGELVRVVVPQPRPLPALALVVEPAPPAALAPAEAPDPHHLHAQTDTLPDQPLESPLSTEPTPTPKAPPTPLNLV
jgi:hypothetical protein